MGVASSYLRLFGLALGATSLAALALMGRKDAMASAALIAQARFFAENLLPATGGLERIVVGGGDALSENRRIWTEALADVA